MLVTIVYVPTPDLRGPDLSRMEKVEDLDPELARMMLADGTARQPSDDELAAYEESRKVEEKADAAVADGGDLSKLRKTDLLALALERGVEVDESATKATIVDALEKAQQQPADAEPADAGAVRQAQPGDIAKDGILAGPHTDTTADAGSHDE